MIRSRDGLIRRVIVKYRNSNEEFDRVTERSARKLIKVWSVDDPDLNEDLGKLQARIDQLQGHLDEGFLVDGGAENQGAAAVPRMLVNLPAPRVKLKCLCCCQEHCNVNLHNLYGSKAFINPLSDLDGFQIESNYLEEEINSDENTTDDEECEIDDLTTLIMGVGVNFS